MRPQEIFMKVFPLICYITAQKTNNNSGAKPSLIKGVLHNSNWIQLAVVFKKIPNFSTV